MEKNTTSRLTLKQKIGYGCGDAGGLFTFSLMSAFFTRYCLNILGVSTEQLGIALHSLFTTASAASFLAFCLLYTPCVAAVSTIKTELKSGWKTVGIVFAQCLVAWLAAFMVYHVGLLLA